MNIHEFQAKRILQEYGIPIPKFAVVKSVAEARKAIDELGLDQAVVKVQIHAGGRGKAGGVKFAKGREQILKTVEQLLGLKIINNQTGPEGVVAHQLLLTYPEELKKQYYVGAIIDRAKGEASLIVSPEGGMDIEEVAATHPEHILTVPICLSGKLRRYQLLNIAKFMGWTNDVAEQGMRIVSGLAKAFMDCDASLLEINPLALNADDKLLAIDAKLAIDDNALFRHKDFVALYDPTQIPKREARARDHDLAYVALDGSIGCMVNGAGLAMATMDIIYHYGGSPANFLDVGGGASQEKVAEGFKIILSDENVKAILVNIFGGIMNCVTLAAGIISAAGELEVQVPLIVRMEGTNVEMGKKMLKESGLNIITADSMGEAAKKAVAAVKGR